MKPRTILVIIIAGILLGMSAYYFGSRLSSGDPAPAFDLPDTQGQHHTLQDFHGEVVLVYFWATWCGICQAETPAIERLYQEYRAKGLTLISILEDKPHPEEALQAFRLHIPFTFPVLLDEFNAAADAYGNYGVPEFFLIGRDGVIIERISGPLDESLRTKIEEVLK